MDALDSHDTEGRVQVYEIVASWLHRRGFDPLFGLMGDGNMRYLSRYRTLGGRFVAAAHEGAAVAMADGYSRVSGKVGVATVTHGPGLTNTVTQLIEASRNRSELLVLTGSAPSEPTYPQRLDLAALARTAEAGYERVHASDAVERALERALQSVMETRRPVVIDVPSDVITDEAHVPLGLAGPVAPGRPMGTPESVDEVLGLLASANRPILLAGWGAVASGSRGELIELASRTGAALATTLKAKDFFRGHPRNLGIFGSLSNRTTLSLIGEADAVVAFGASLNMFTTLKRELTRGKRLAQIDLSTDAIGSYAPVDVGVGADVGVMARQMLDRLAEASFDRRESEWIGHVVTTLSGHDDARDYSDRSSENTIDLRTAMRTINGYLAHDRSVVFDVGRYTVGAWPYVEVPEPRRLVNMGAFASIGLGLAATVGVSQAAPEALPVAILGDGGFMMNPVELATLVRECERAVVIVCNDAAYGAEYYRFESIGLDPDHARTNWPCLRNVGEALGARAITIRSVEDLTARRSDFEQVDGVLFVDLRLDPDVNVIDQ